MWALLPQFQPPGITVLVSTAAVVAKANLHFLGMPAPKMLVLFRRRHSLPMYVDQSHLFNLYIAVISKNLGHISKTKCLILWPDA